jgi:linear primary-alkylsulfatase
MTKDTFDRIRLREITPQQAIASGDMQIAGKGEAFAEFVSLLDNFPFWFNIVTP